MKKFISVFVSAVMIFAFCAGLTVVASAYAQLDALFINKSSYSQIGYNYMNAKNLTIFEGDRLFILGWVTFTRNDGLKEIKYQIAGKEYACSDVYRDRPDAASQPGMYNNGEHAGYGTDENMMELIGISELEAGNYTFSLVAYSNKGSKNVFRTYSLTVSEGLPHMDFIQKNEAAAGIGENLLDRSTVTVKKGDKLYILGWVAFGKSDKLNNVIYSVDGKEYVCSDVYMDRTDVASSVTVYNNGEHTGFGSNEQMMELTGISELPAGKRTVDIYGISDKGKTVLIYSLQIRIISDVVSGQSSVINGSGDINGDNSTNNKDVVILFRHISGMTVNVIAKNADVNGDGKINNKDVVILFRYLCGMPVVIADNYEGTPAYTVEGDQIVVDGVCYPNTLNMTNGVTYAVDDLKRELTTETETYVSDGSKNVGLFYFLWLGEHGDWGVYDITKILETGGAAAKKASYSGWGPVNAMHFWSEPLYGYYYSRDKWVMRKHIEELTLANVDFLYIDVTNAFAYINNSLALMSIMHEFNEQGYNAPKIVFYTHTSSSTTVNSLYNSIYKANKYPDTWFYVDGKPLIIAYQNECAKLSYEAYNFFTYREPQWPDENQKTNGWPWMDFSYPQRVFVNKSGKQEAISVSVAQHSGTVCFSESAIYGNRSDRGRSYHNGSTGISEDSALYGYNFEEQFNRAIEANVPYILITGWNEWAAQRQDPGQNNRVIFVDTCTMEYSRDIEPMKGGYFDNYYMQLVNLIRKYKGSAPVFVQDKRKVIDLNSGFDQWNDILVTYTDPKGDTVNRNSTAFGNKTATDKSGNNDIVASKIVYDRNNIYFYAETADNISDPSAALSWMRLFVDSDYDGYSGFYGFDYIVNYKVKSNGTTTVAKIEKSGNTYKVVSTEDIEYTVNGNKIMIKVPLQFLDIYSFEDIMIAFKWVDSKTEIKTMEQMYSEGDAAPLGRLCYTFINHK